MVIIRIEHTLLFMTKTNKFWEEIDNIINEAIYEISTKIDSEINNIEACIDNLPINKLFLKNGEVWVNYNINEEMLLKEASIEEILFIHEILCYI